MNQTNNTYKGKFAERKARNYLESVGFVVIEQNFYAKKMGEIDIVATKNGIWHFVEVKSGKGFEPIYNITRTKLQKVIKSAELYLKAKSLEVAYCIDALIITDGEISLLENVTLV